MLLSGYARSQFRDFKSYLKIVVGLKEDDIQINLIQNISYFIIFEIPPSIYSIKDISEAFYTKEDYEETLHFE